MNQSEKWTLPNCSLGIPLRDFSGCVSDGESQDSELWELMDHQPLRVRVLAIRSTECWQWKDPEGDLMPSFYRWGN